MVDACTGYVMVYPSRNLLAPSVRQHLLTYLSSHLTPQEIKSDFGPEFQQQLDSYLATYGIQLTSSKPYSKGSTAQAESVYMGQEQAEVSCTSAIIHIQIL